MAEKKKHLVVVESPAKARTIGKYLGSGYRVVASVGHIRDLPSRELGVDIENCFAPKYVTIRGKGRVIQDLKRQARGATEIILATDPDREGEAIAFHVAEQLGWSAPESPAAGNGDPAAGASGNGAAPAPNAELQPQNDRFRRIRFFEITGDAVREALQQPGSLDMRKVEAQQARRILDRLVGFKVSPLLWKPIRSNLSAGRVQTVALRLISEREAEIRAFVPEEYWSVTAELEKEGEAFEAKLHHIDGGSFRLENEESTNRALADIDGVPFVVTEIKRRERRKNAPAPFTTSTLQQEAAKRLGFSVGRTMRAAQQLYEGIDVGREGLVGLITYMRTDSTRVSRGSAEGARSWVEQRFGSRYTPRGVRQWGGRKQKAAQEAHEAVRPTDARRDPASLKGRLKPDQHRLYELIWLRFVASQMSPAIYDTTRVDFDLAGESGTRYLFRANGSIMKFDGFTRLYRETREDGDRKTLDDFSPLPEIDTADRCDLRKMVPAQHFTQPPSRFSEATLVKEMEKLGIGRPSTYAQIIKTLRDKKYVEMQAKRFHPTTLGDTVSGVLVQLFPKLFDAHFTSRMEDELDRIEEGELDWCGVLTEFYEPFEAQLSEGKNRVQEVVKQVVAPDAPDCPECGRELEVKWSKYGRFLGCSGYPDCRYTQPLEGEEPKEPEPIGEDCPECGHELRKVEGRAGTFIGCSNYPECTFTRPITIPGLTCPECGEGEVGEKRTRKGKPFWGCTRYPECKWSVWSRPVPTECEMCENPYLLVKSTKKKGEFLRCPSCKAEYLPETAGAAAE